MAAKTKRTSKKANTIEKDRYDPDKSELVKTYGILWGHVVRWQDNGEGGTYTEGKAHYVENDGSICIWAMSGGWRCIMPERLEKTARGPKGGKLWVPLVD